MTVRTIPRIMQGASAIALAAALAASPALAQGTAPSPPTAAPPAHAGTAAVSPASHAPGHASDRVEQRIAQLHKELKITPAQSQQWDSFAQVMRDNAQQMDTLWQQKMANGGAGTAVEEMQTYAQMSQAHAQEMQNLLQPFQTLYTTLSPQQQKLADQAFAPRHGGTKAATRGAARSNSNG